MILFSSIYHLLWLVPLVLLWILLFRKQYAALVWIRNNISPRFQGSFTRYGKLSLPLHMTFLLLMGTLLVLALAGPYTSGMVEKEVDYGNVVLVIDASLSMAANDTKHATRVTAKNRLEQAKVFAIELIDGLPHHRFALISFSGIAAIHSPPTRDRIAIKRAVESLTLHAFQSMGSSLKGGLARIIHMAKHKSGNYQAVIISDGEIPKPENFDSELDVLARNKIVVHTIGVGSRKGGSVGIYDPSQVRNRIMKPKVAKRITSRRTDKHLKEIASRTDGEFIIPSEGDSLKDLFHEIEKGAKEKALIRSPGKKDLSSYLFAAFLICFLCETLLLAHIMRPAGQTFEAFGRKTAALLILIAIGPLISGCGNRLWQAHMLNEKGLALYGFKQHSSAQSEFEKSASYNVKEEIPNYNLANNYLKIGNYSAAHKLYQEAIKSEPNLKEALFNDGHALYEWGRKELDPRAFKDPSRACNVKRTIALWKQAIKRFEQTAKLDKEKKKGPLHDKAIKNAEFIKQRLKKLEEIAKKCKQDKKQNKSDKKQDKKESKSDKDKKQNKKEKKQDKKDDKGKKGDKDKGKKDSKGDKDKGKKGGKGEDDGDSWMKPGKGGDRDKRGKDGLSSNERDEIKEEIERIKKQSKGKKFEQTKTQQIQYGKPGKKGKKGKSLKKGKKGRGGPVILW